MPLVRSVRSQLDPAWQGGEAAGQSVFYGYAATSPSEVERAFHLGAPGPLLPTSYPSPTPLLPLSYPPPTPVKP